MFMPVTTMIGEGMTTIDKIIVDSMMTNGMIIGTLRHLDNFSIILKDEMM